MRTTYSAALAAAVIGIGVVTGCGDDSTAPMDHSTMDQSMMDQSMENTAEVDADFNMADVMFARMMYPHHAEAVDMADMVDGRSTNPDVIALAAEIRAAQQPEMDQMVTWLEEWGQPAPSDMGQMDGMDHGSGGGMMSTQDMDSLMSLSGAEFDREWLTMMIEHHEGAVEMAETEIADGSNPDAVSMARDIVETQNAEIERMKQLLG